MEKWRELENRRRKGIKSFGLLVRGEWRGEDKTDGRINMTRGDDKQKLLLLFVTHTPLSLPPLFHHVFFRSLLH